ncbi:hypothetical protein [Microbulbifer agarilyticus]
MLKRLFASRKNPYVPGLNRREKVEIDISGSRLTMLLPPHSDSEGFSRERPPSEIDLHNPENFYIDESSPKWQRSGNAHYRGRLANRHWEFFGPPWHTRPYGFITFSIVISRQDAMPEGMSCFNPAHLEQSIIRNLFFSAGGPAQPTLPKEKGPFNWQLHHHSEATGIYFERHRDFSKYNLEPENFERASHSCTLRLPLEHRYSLGVSFGYLGYAPSEYSLKNMNAVRDLVLSSVRLELGPEAREQLAEAQKKWPDAHASEYREPVFWDYPEWRKGDYSKGEPNIVLVKPGSSPPEFTP